MQSTYFDPGHRVLKFDELSQGRLYYYQDE